MSENIVIGANGLVGSHVIIHLLKQNKQVTAVSRDGKPSNLFFDLLKWYQISEELATWNISWKSADITDIFSLESIINEKAIVYHCAGLVSFHDSDSAKLKNVNAEGTANLVDVCVEKRIRKLAYVSSVSTLSLKENTNVLDENSFWKTDGNESNYARSKYLAEMEVWRGVEEGLNAVIVNPTIIIGPHDFTKGSVQLIDTVFKGLKFYPVGSTGFVDANDVALALIQLAESDKSEQRYVLNGVNMSYQKLFQLIADELNVAAPKIKVSSWMSKLAWRIEKLRSKLINKKPLITKETAHASVQERYFDNAKVCADLAFQFTLINQTIQNTCSFYINQNK